LRSSVIEERYDKKYPGKESPSLEIIDSLKTAVLTFNTFEDSSWLTFLEPSFKTIRDKKIQNLIIDVRQNRGGSDLYGSNLYAYLALAPYEYYNHIEIRLDSLNDPILKYGFLDTAGLQGHVGKNYLKKMPNGNYLVDKKQNAILDDAPLTPAENSFKGKVFILTSYKTSSGGSEFCGIAHFLKRAVFIGQETGGGYCGNSSGKLFILSLPNTKIRALVPLMRYYAAVGNCQGQGGIKPDYEITPSIEDLNPNTDREMKTALDLIRKPQ
jgi:C-terminal processing protease CtpA/Prc